MMPEELTKEERQQSMERLAKILMAAADMMTEANGFQLGGFVLLGVGGEVVQAKRISEESYVKALEEIIADARGGWDDFDKSKWPEEKEADEEEAAAS